MSKARRFNANHATRAVLTLSAALLFGLGLRLGDAAVKKAMPFQTAAAPATPQESARQVVNTSTKFTAPQATTRPAQPAQPSLVPPAPLKERIVYVNRTVYVPRPAAASQPEQLVYASSRGGGEGEDDHENGDDEGEYRRSTTSRTSVVAPRPVSPATRQIVQPRTRYAVPVQARAVRPVASRTVPAAQPRTVAQVQPVRPRFVPQAPVRSRATTRGS